MISPILSETLMTASTVSAVKELRINLCDLEVTHSTISIGMWWRVMIDRVSIWRMQCQVEQVAIPDDT